MQTIAFLKFYTTYTDDQAHVRVIEKSVAEKSGSSAMKADAAGSSSQGATSAIAGKAATT